MSFCEHCEGQRFDRARVLRAVRQIRRELRTAGRDAECDDILDRVLKTLRDMEIPHLEFEDEEPHVVH
jgi:hypothetical protein